MQDAYRKAFKGTSLFAGVQIFQILISLLQGKFVALFLGSEGMGISGLYTSSLSMLVTVAGLGCSLSFVRYISGLEKGTALFWQNIRAIKGIFLAVSFFGLIRISASYFRLVVCSVCLLSGLFFVLRLNSPLACFAAVSMAILYAVFSLCLLERRICILRSIRNSFLKKGREKTV